MLEVTQQRDGLQSFSQTHFIGQDSVDPILVERDHPVETTYLIVSHFAALNVSGRCVETKYLLGVRIFGQQLLILLLFRFTMSMAGEITIIGDKYDV